MNIMRSPNVWLAPCWLSLEKSANTMEKVQNQCWRAVIENTHGSAVTSNPAYMMMLCDDTINPEWKIKHGATYGKSFYLTSRVHPLVHYHLHWEAICAIGTSSWFSALPKDSSTPWLKESGIKPIRERCTLPTSRWRLVRDIVKPHPGHMTTARLCSESGLVLNWPACSPACHPLKWDLKKQKARQRRPQNIERMKSYIKQEWIPLSQVNLVDMQPQGCITKNGNATEPQDDLNNEMLWWWICISNLLVLQFNSIDGCALFCVFLKKNQS